MGDDDKRALGAVWEWTHQYGAALKPPGADTYGEGMRDAKEQVQRLLSGASSMSADLATLRAQRDEARALVRRYVEAEMDPTDEDGDGRRGSFLASRSAVARWDEEEKKR